MTATSRTGLRCALFASVVLALSLLQASAALAGDAGNYLVDAAHDGDVTGFALHPALAEQWTDTFAGAVSYPLAAGGRVFALSGGSGSGKVLWALDQASGAVLWSRPIADSSHWAADAYDRQSLFVVNSVGVLSSFDAVTGAAQWSEQLPYQYWFTSAPTAIDGTIYLAGAGNGGTIYAVRESDGHLLWSAFVENGDMSAPAVSGSQVFVTYAGFQDFAFDRITGALNWHVSGCCEGGGGATPVAANGLVFSLTSGEIYGEGDGGSVAPLGANAPPAVSGGVLYEVGASGLTAIAGSGRGAPLWTFAGDGTLQGSPIIVGSLVFATSTSGMLYAINTADGSAAWSTAVATGADSGVGSTISAADGSLLVSAGDSVSAFADPVPPLTVPASLTAPSISGTVSPGQLLTAAVGTWTGSPSTFDVTWQRCDAGGGACVALTSAADLTYLLSAGDIGTTIRVSVTAHNAAGPSLPAQSPSTPAIALATGVTDPAPAGAPGPPAVQPARTGPAGNMDATPHAAGSVTIGRISSAAQLLRHGVSARVHCLTRCQVQLAVLAHPTRGSRVTVLADRTRTLTTASRTQIAARLRTAGARILRRQRRTVLTVAVTLTGTSGRVTTVMSRVAVHRP
jgi:outer membrane protein assembly factor BamB